MPQQKSSKVERLVTNLLSTGIPGRALIVENLEARNQASATQPFNHTSLDSYDYRPNLDEESIIRYDSSETSLQSTSHRELVLIDADLPDSAGILAGLDKLNGGVIRYDVVTLQGQGVREITSILAQYQDLDAVHLLSHSADGILQIGTDQLTLDNIHTFSEDLNQWSRSLSAQGDLLLYGCDLAANDTGKALISTMRSLIKADIAASTNYTGIQNGITDWNLEYQVGLIDATSLSIESWSSSLTLTPKDTFLVNTTTNNDQVTESLRGGTQHPVAMNSSGNYVVVWESNGQDGDGKGVYAQRFNSAGNKVGSEFRVNQITARDQYQANVAMDNAGNFVVTWT